MERTDLFELMGELKLYGMRMAYDEVMTTGIKRQHEPAQIVGELLKESVVVVAKAVTKDGELDAGLRLFGGQADEVAG